MTSDCRTYKQFMADHQIPKGSELKPTHTRMPSKTYNVHGGSFHIPPEDIEEFYKKYEEYVFIEENKEFLTEKQTQDIFVVDFDFRYDLTQVTSRQHTQEHIDEMVLLYAKKLEEYYILSATEVYIYVMEKPNVNIISDNNITKDGIHLLMSISVDRNIQMEIREKMISFLPNTSWKDLLIINKNGWKDVLDEGITKGSTNWTLYGSRKPGHEAYKPTYVYSWTAEKVERYDINSEEYNNLGKFLSEVGLSVQTTKINHLELRKPNIIESGFAKQASLPPKKRKADENNNDQESSTATKVMRIEDPQIMEDYKKLEYFFTNGFDSAEFSHPDMCNIGYAIHSMFGIDHGLSLFCPLRKNIQKNWIGKMNIQKSSKNI